MLQGIARIEEAMKDVSKEEFFQSRLLLDAMSFNFAILGEAANKVSDALQAKHGRSEEHTSELQSHRRIQAALLSVRPRWIAV